MQVKLCWLMLHYIKPRIRKVLIFFSMLAMTNKSAQSFISKYKWGWAEKNPVALLKITQLKENCQSILQGTMKAKPHSRLFLYWSYFPSTECIILIHISDGICTHCSLNDFIFRAQSHERILKDLFNLLIWKSVWMPEKPSYFISLTWLFLQSTATCVPL